MKYYRATEDVTLKNGKSYPAGHVTSEISYDGLPDDVKGKFEEDEETTGKFGEVPQPDEPVDENLEDEESDDSEESA